MIRREHGQRLKKWTERKSQLTATVNVGTVTGETEEEVMQLMKDRRLDIVGLCEIRLSEEGTMTIHDDYHLFRKGRENTRHAVSCMVTEEML